MKNVLIILLLLFSVLSFSQAEKDVINDFLELELRDYKIDSIHVQIEPLDVIDAIKLYEQGYKERNPEKDNRESVWVKPYFFKDWPFTVDDIEDIKSKLNQTNKNWTESDFRNKSFVFYHASILKDAHFRVSHGAVGTTEYVLRLSRPVFGKKKNYALFKYYLSELLMGGSPESGHRGTVIMKKENSKWIALASIREAIYQ